MLDHSISHSYDVLIIGTGAAGLALSLKLLGFCSIALVSKGPLRSGSTLWAQGGIAAVLSEEDSIASHVEDTLRVGTPLCDPRITEFTVKQAPDQIRWLMDQGLLFSTVKDRLELTQEAGHSHRRIVHALDATGRALSETLSQRVEEHPEIHCFLHHTAINLIIQENRATGAYLLDNNSGKITTIQAKAVVLATGGASKVYLYTTNPDSSTGDGIAMAARVGCRIANMAFNQFHPTCLYHHKAKSFLISEAVRGEGGILRLPNGERFMARFDPRQELAPRDIVARAIDHEIKRLGIECVYLDITHQPSTFIRKRFPTIYERCLSYGIDMTKEPIPVVPAAHYTCGGVVTDEFGQTDCPGLYAIGEVACTGLHGSNRLASNSLLECLVFATSTADHLKKTLPLLSTPKTAPAWDESRVIESRDGTIVAHDWDEIRRLMWDYVGIVRTTQRLQLAKKRLGWLIEEVRDQYTHYKITQDLIELRNIVLLSDLIVQSALNQSHNYGLHYNLDLDTTLS